MTLGALLLMMFCLIRKAHKQNHSFTLAPASALLVRIHLGSLSVVMVTPETLVLCAGTE